MVWYSTEFYDIKRKLESMGHEINVDGYSNIGLSMTEFDNLSKSDTLFSFLIENSLNKYLFGVLLRIGSLDINNIPFREESLDPRQIEDKVSESFIKKFECKSCNHLLFRKHVFELDNYINEDYYCPICDIGYKLEYDSLEDDYTINRNDLIKYLDRLIEIDILEKKLMYKCQKCVQYENYDSSSLICNNCGLEREIIYKYCFKDEFLQINLKNRDGRWFEWYMYKICEHIFEKAEHNLMISFENSGFKDECEIDVVSIKDNEIIIYECKDYLKGKIGLTDLQNLPKLSKIFEKIFLVSSNKAVTKKTKNTLTVFVIMKLNL